MQTTTLSPPAPTTNQFPVHGKGPGMVWFLQPAKLRVTVFFLFTSVSFIFHGPFLSCHPKRWRQSLTLNVWTPELSWQGLRWGPCGLGNYSVWLRFSNSVKQKNKIDQDFYLFSRAMVILFCDSFIWKVLWKEFDTSCGLVSLRTIWDYGLRLRFIDLELFFFS